eukprot:3906334-Pyramimonas_sp.AAC.1
MRGRRRRRSTDRRMSGASQDTASSAKEYFEVHGVLQYVQALLHAMIQERPGDFALSLSRCLPIVT